MVRSRIKKIIGISMAVAMIGMTAGCFRIMGGGTTDTSDGDKFTNDRTESTEYTGINSLDIAEDRNESEQSIPEVSDTASEAETSKDTDNDTAGSPSFPDRPYANDGTGQIKWLSEGDVAPDFTADLVDGSTFRLSDHDDGVVLLNFFATWCGPCMGEMPAFEMLQADGYENLSILCVDCMEDAGTVDQFVRETGYTFPIAYDERAVIEDYYPTDGIPYTLVIDHGVIRNIYIGAYSADVQYQEYKSAIDACME